LIGVVHGASFNSNLLGVAVFCYTNYSCLCLLYAGCGYYLFQHEGKNMDFSVFAERGGLQGACMTSRRYSGVGL
jgi:hypothetical protein